MDINKKIEELKEQHKVMSLKIQGAIEILEAILEEDKPKKEKK